MSTYSNAPNVAGAIAASGTASTFALSVTIYTAPADSYGLVNLNIQSSAGSGAVLIGGVGIFNTGGSSSLTTFTGVVIGPGQSVVLTVSGGGSPSIAASISGVLLTNGA